jgi:uncharacterized membrane protein
MEDTDLAARTSTRAPATVSKASGRAKGDYARQVNVGRRERPASTLAGAALAAYGLTRGSLGGLALALAGVPLIYRGLSGHCHAYAALGIDRASRASGVLEGNLGVKIDTAITIAAPPARLYRFWRNFENLPRIMSHVESVRMTSPTHSRWTVRAAAGLTAEWDAEIINDKPDELIAWRSVGHPSVPHAGSVRFERAADGHGTRVRVSLQYDRPGGELGHAVASLFGGDAGARIDDDLKRFKAAVEAGAIAAA